MRRGLVDELEDFVARGDLWSSEELALLVGHLRDETDRTGDPNPSLLADALADLVDRVATGGLATRTAHEVEAIVYPRVWKVMEAVRGGLPPGEVRTRIVALDRHLGRLLCHEGAQ